VISNKPFINVYKKKSLKSEVVTQLLYGELFTKIQKKGSWTKVKNNTDGYKGFIKEKTSFLNIKNTHKIFNLNAKLFKKPNSKSKINKSLSFGSKIKVIKKKGIYYKFDNLWIKKNDLKKNNYRTKDIFKYIRQFIGVKYKWGGKCYDGIDCSGLVQIFFNFNNKFCPRDAKDQVKFFKKKVKLKDIKKNDLIFWKGHVAIALSNKKLIHAYGPLKKTVVMPIDKTISRIFKTANLKVIGIRRINY
jgi:cell wall-associated NlpC family hydrolase